MTKEAELKKAILGKLHYMQGEVKRMRDTKIPFQAQEVRDRHQARYDGMEEVIKKLLPFIKTP